jgi:hypothetical protein
MTRLQFVPMVSLMVPLIVAAFVTFGVGADAAVNRPDVQGARGSPTLRSFLSVLAEAAYTATSMAMGTATASASGMRQRAGRAAASCSW